MKEKKVPLGKTLNPSDVSRHASNQPSNRPGTPSQGPASGAEPGSAISPVKIPSLLFEPDTTSLPAGAGQDRRFVLAPPPAEPATATAGPPLPGSYGTGKVLLKARDPHWLYIHWELTEAQKQKLNAASEPELVVRVHRDRVADVPVAETRTR